MEPRKFKPVLSLLFLLSFLNLAYSQNDTIVFGGYTYAIVEPRSGYSDRTSEELSVNVSPKFRMNENQVNIRAVRDFVKEYPGIIQALWSGSETGYSVRFYKDEALTTIYYTPSGKRKLSIKRYPESKLPERIRRIIKPVYYDYAVVFITEILGRNTREPAYYVHMKLGRNYKVVEVANGETREVQSFELQK